MISDREVFDDADPLIDRRLTQAFSHPIRLRILEVLAERVALTPSQGLKVLHEEGEEIDLVEFGDHMAILLDLKFAELVLPEGEVGFGYRLAIGSFVDDTVWHKVPNRLRPAAWVSALQAFTRASISALAAGTIERRESQFNLLPIALDDQGWRKVVGAIAESLFLVEEAHQESTQRAAVSGDPDELSRALISLTAFEVAPTQGVVDG
jgi:hypothetical protein